MSYIEHLRDRIGHRTKVVTRLREYLESGEINEGNWSTIREGWIDIEDLVSIRDGIYGTAAGWVCAIASEWVLIPAKVDADDVQSLAPRLLCLTSDQWESVLELPPQCAIERLELLCFGVMEAA